MSILTLFNSKDKKKQLTPEEQRRKESLIANLTEEGKISDVEKKEREKEVIHSFPNVFSKKDINYLIKIYGLQNTQIIGGAIDNIYWSILDSVNSKDVIHYFDNLSQRQIDLLKNKELTINFGKLVKQHKTKTNSILTVKRLMKEGNGLMDQYNKENYGVDWRKQLEEKKAQEKRDYEKKVEKQKAKEEQEKSAKEEKQKILDTLADSRKSYEQADPKTQETMVNTRRGTFNRGLDLYSYPADAFDEDDIRQIISTYGADNMQKLLDIVNIVYVQAMPHISGIRKTEALMDQILSQQELNSIDNGTIQIFQEITKRTRKVFPLKTLVKDRAILCRTLNSK